MVDCCLSASSLDSRGNDDDDDDEEETGFICKTGRLFPDETCERADLAAAGVTGGV